MNFSSRILSALFLTLLVTCSASLAMAQTYPIVDTGQVRAYDDRSEIEYPKSGQSFFGQDAQYKGNQPSYRDNGDGTVADLVTGLMWQKDPGEKVTYAQAIAGASTCRTGGYDDWRLPSIKEMYSLIMFYGEDVNPMLTDTTGLKPFIDTEYFDFSYGDPSKGERVIDSQMATSTKYVSTTMLGDETVFGVNFADGRIKGYPAGDRPGRGAKTYFVFYVRGNPDYGKNKFRDNGDGTITDQATGLTWMQLDSGHLKAGDSNDGKLDWEQALAWAEGLEYAGHDDWRLPNIKELQSILDYTRSPDTTNSPAIDPLFRVTPIRDGLGDLNYPFYWSSTTHLRDGGQASGGCYFAFGRSQGWMPNRQGGRDLLDVHGAGSQRSDPKSGDPSQFPQGRGPQGDVIGIYNMVRLVRGGDVTTRTEGPELEPQNQRPRGMRQGPPEGMMLGGMQQGMGQGMMRPGRPGMQQGMGPGMQQPNMPGAAQGFVERLDRDGDGRVSRQEFDGPTGAFDMQDANKDGYLDESEAPQGPPPGIGQSGMQQGPGQGMQGPPMQRPGMQGGNMRGSRQQGMGPGMRQRPQQGMQQPGRGTQRPNMQRPGMQQPSGSMQQQRPAMGTSGVTSRFITMFDRNQDGKVTSEEFDGAPQRFATLDSNSDGVVTSEEAAQAGPPGGGRQATQQRGGPAGQRPAGGPPAGPGGRGASLNLETNWPTDIDEAVRADDSWNELPPSFVFILADDMGWTGLSSSMDASIPNSQSDFYQTPRIDALAQQGMRFSNAYSPSSMCTPSRASILTGKSPALTRMTTPGKAIGQATDRMLIPPQHVDALPESETTIAELLKDRGYTTAHFGKWHLNGGGPARHGFEYHDGETGNTGPGDYEDPNPKDIFGITDRGIALMRQQVADGKPFYLQLSHYAVHSPPKALDSTMQQYANKPAGKRHNSVEHGAMTNDLDGGVGMILDEIERLGIADNTYVIFMSDNGAPAGPTKKYENLPLSGGKATFWEGGIRVPLIVRGPGVPADTTCHERVVGFDLYPTLCDLADVADMPAGVEGGSIAPLLAGNANETVERPRPELVFHFPHYARGPDQTPQSAIYLGDYKLLRNYETDTNHLFNLSNDIGEQRDLAKVSPEKASAMERSLFKYLREVEAQMPTENPNYVPNDNSSTTRGRASNRRPGAQ